MAVRRFLLPDLGEGLEDAEIVAWRVAEGEPVELNQTLVEVNTAKAMVEIPSPWDGVVSRLHANDGDVVKVGEPLVSIDVDVLPAHGVREGSRTSNGPVGGREETEREPGHGAADGSEAGAARPRRRAVLVGYGVAEDEPPSSGGAPARERSDTAEGGRRGPVRATPPVRRLAKELGIDLAAVGGTGPEGRVTREDVLEASRTAGVSAPLTERPGAEPSPPPGEVERIPVRGTRRLIAEKMARSAREIPHVTTFLTLDATHLLAFRDEIERATGERVTPLAILVRALVETCGEHPKLNASFHQDPAEIVLHRGVHVGIATDTQHGLLAPVLRDAGDRGILDIAREIRRLAEAARAGRARPEELTGSTMTVSNVGSFGAEYGTPIINFPEAAILALGVIEPKALVVDGRVEARPATVLSLSFDHRVMDGAEAGRALKALGTVLQSPFKLGALPR